MAGRTMQSREATGQDSAALARIQVTSYRTAYVGLLPAGWLAQFSEAEQEEDWRELLAKPEGELIEVAESEQGEVVGYALGRLNAEAPRGELVALHILPAYQRQGVGRLLFAAMLARLRQRGAASFWLSCLAANPIRAWYERLGGELVEERSVEIAGEPIREVLYAWAELDALAARL